MVEAITKGSPMHKPDLDQLKDVRCSSRRHRSDSPTRNSAPAAPSSQVSLGGGFGAITDPGVGVAYFIQPEAMYFHVATRSDTPAVRACPARSPLARQRTSPPSMPYSWIVFGLRSA